MVEELVWDNERIKGLFQKHRVYPTFIGVKNSLDKHTRGITPVLLWPEQVHSLQFTVEGAQYSQPNSSNKNKGKKSSDDDKNKGKKRKREDSPAAPPSTPVIKETPAPKRSRTTSSFFFDLLSTFTFGLIPRSLPAPPSIALRDNKTVRLVPINPKDVTPPPDIHSVVYLDLVKQGYLVGPGQLYGGDYNVYERGKDPSSSHSVATIRALGTPKVSGRDLLSFTRVQNQVQALH